MPPLADDPRNDLPRAMRDLSAQIGLYTQAVADRAAVAATDVNLLGLLGDLGPSSTGTLSEHAGVTPGAITRAIDRLEKAGYVEREVDLDDRRRVIIRTTPKAGDVFEPLFGPLRDATTSASGRLSDAQVDIVVDFARASTSALRSATTRLRDNETGGASTATVETHTAVPLGDRKRGRLELQGKAAQAQIVADDRAGDTLFRVDTKGATPDVSVRGDTVHLRLVQRKHRGSELIVYLNPSIPWSFDLNSTATHLELDLRSMVIESIKVRGNAGHIEIDLPTPERVTPVQVAGHASHIELLRHLADTPMKAYLKGFTNSLTAERRKVKAGGRGTSWESKSFRKDGPHYDVAVNGNANHLRIK